MVGLVIACGAEPLGGLAFLGARRARRERCWCLAGVDLAVRGAWSTCRAHDVMGISIKRAASTDDSSLQHCRDALEATAMA